MSRSSLQVLNRGLWWMVFGIATFALSIAFQTFRVFTLTPTLDTGLKLVAAVLLLIAVLLVLLYDSYVKEKGKGNIHHPFKLFEWVYARQFANKSHQGGS
jgi:hypothetical protein